MQRVLSEASVRVAQIGSTVAAQQPAADGGTRPGEDDRRSALRAFFTALSREWLRITDAHTRLVETRRARVEALALRAEERAHRLAVDDRLARVERAYLRQRELCRPVIIWALRERDAAQLEEELRDARAEVGRHQAAARRRNADGAQTARNEWDRRRALAHMECVEATLLELHAQLAVAPMTDEEGAQRMAEADDELRRAREEWEDAIGLSAPPLYLPGGVVYAQAAFDAAPIDDSEMA